MMLVVIETFLNGYKVSYFPHFYHINVFVTAFFIRDLLDPS